MTGKTTIEWTDDSWNPVRFRDKATGKIAWYCEHVSDGCTFCYAETKNLWLGTKLAFIRQNRDLVEPFLDEERMLRPMPKKPSMIFTGDMSDLFADFVKADWIDRIVDVIAHHPQHVYQLLTKRPERARDFFCRQPPPSNLWLGVSVERARHLDRLDMLYATPAAIRFARSSRSSKTLARSTCQASIGQSSAQRATCGTGRDRSPSTGCAISVTNALPRRCRFSSSRMRSPAAKNCRFPNSTGGSGISFRR